MSYKTILELFPNPTELRKRAILFDKINSVLGIEQTVFSENFNNQGYERYFWEDGAGNEANIIFKADGVNPEAVLVYGYDHESIFNYYDSDNKQIVFDGVPESFLPLLENGSLVWSWDTGSEKKVYATTAIWRDKNDNEWHINPEFVKQAEDEQENGGFNYFFKLFMRPLDAERVKKEYADRGYEDSDLAAVEETFNTYYKEPLS